MRAVDLKALAKQRGLRGHAKLRKAKLITFLRNKLQPTPAPRPPPRPRPRHPTRPPPPPPQLVRPRQPPTSEHPQSVGPKPAPTFKPYQLKPKRGKIEPPVEVPPPSNPKQIKRMKKKLSKLNKKIRHSKAKHNNLISIVSQLSKCLKFMTFREGCFVIRNSWQVLK